MRIFFSLALFSVSLVGCDSSQTSSAITQSDIERLEQSATASALNADSDASKGIRTASATGSAAGALTLPPRSRFSPVSSPARNFSSSPS